MLDTITQEGAQRLFDYGVLGVIAVAFLALVVWVLRSSAADKKQLMDFLLAREKEHNKQIKEFTACQLETARALDKLSALIEARDE